VKARLFSPRASIIARILAILLLQTHTASAVEIDLSTEVFKQGAMIKAESSEALPAALLYNVRFEVNGSGTGTFEPLFGSGDLIARLQAIAPGAAAQLQFTLPNLPRKFPVSLGATRIYQQLSPVPLGNGVTDGSFEIAGKVKAQVTKSGTVKVSASKMKFKASDSSGSPLSFDGAYTVNVGKLIIEPAVASSVTPQPDFIVLRNSHITSGNDEYETQSPGTVDVTFVKRGKSTSNDFIIQNDGPSPDSFKLRALFHSSSLSVRVFDGKKEITDQVAPAVGYPIDNLPSGGTRVFRLVVTVSRDAKPGSNLNAGVRVSRTADESVADTGGVSIFVK